jgi:ferredoxin/DNA-binding transcriptional ArsR family regulator
MYTDHLRNVQDLSKAGDQADRQASEKEIAMTANKDLIYTRFIEWLRKTWCELPDAPELLPLVQARYSLEEAEFLTGMPYTPKDVSELSRIMGKDPVELQEKLDALAAKGLVYRRQKGAMVKYFLNDAFFVFLRSSFWHGRTDTETTKLAPIINRYFQNGFFNQYAAVEHKGLRTLPIAETIEGSKTVLPFEDVVQVLDAQDYFVVASCPCRHRKNLDLASPDCPHPVEVCLHFGDLGRYMVQNGLAREINRDEAREVLRISAESGLVHGVSNWKLGVDTICNCCKCCCMWFEGFHVLGHTKSMDVSNYQVRTNPRTCKGCGLCTKRCPMEALSLVETGEARNRKGVVVAADIDKCIGCGVCVYKCPAKSLTLESREPLTEPPGSPKEYMSLFMAERQAAREMAGDAYVPGMSEK